MGDTATATKYAAEVAKATEVRPLHQRAAAAQRKAAAIEGKLAAATDTLANLQRQTSEQAELVRTLVGELETAEVAYKAVLEEEYQSRLGNSKDQASVSKLDLQSLIEGKLNADDLIDCGAMFDLGDDYELDPEEQAEIAKRKEELKAAMQTAAAQLFQQAKEKCEATRTAHEEQKKRLKSKRARSAPPDGPGGGSGASKEPAAAGAQHAPEAGAGTSVAAGPAAPANGTPGVGPDGAPAGPPMSARERAAAVLAGKGASKGAQTRG